MFVNELNLFLFIFVFMLSTVVINVTSALHLVLTAEFLWVNLYSISLVSAYSFDNLAILSLTFFLLILSAIEFGIGLVLILIQNLFLRSIRLNSNTSNAVKFSARFFSKLNRRSTRV